MRRVAIVTDSTAGLPREVAARWGITVVPTQVLIGDWVGDEGAVDGDVLVRALRSGQAVSTSPAAAPAFFWGYQDARAAGFEAVVSIHVSERMSATVESARVAAAQVSIPVHVVDSRTVGMSLGYVALAAADAARTGADVSQVLAVVQRRLTTCTQYYYVDTLEFLRRNGRIGAARSWLGMALGIKPLLIIKDGQVSPLEAVRGQAKAMARLVEIGVRQAGQYLVDAAVEHFGDPVPAARFATQLRTRVPNLRNCYVTAASATVAVHTGPDTLGLAISPC
ncbi:MAG: DegV family protein [Actinobacteria bacterium]|nr:DegV family protein [Actinomycetota bacterium]